MSRRQAVAFCLIDVGFLSDPKFRRLARRLPDPDAFNSAVGAYFIALAASRRAGSSALDVLAETESTYVDDLRAVGLLTETGFPDEAWRAWRPMAAQQASAGAARAASAKRDDKGRMLPSEPSALDALDTVDQRHPALPSPLLPSSSLTGGGAGEGDDPEWLRAWFATGRMYMPTPKQRDLIAGYLRAFDQTGDARLAGVFLRNSEDPIAGLKADLAAFRAQRREEAVDDPQPKPRRAPRPSGLQAELIAAWQAAKGGDAA